MRKWWNVPPDPNSLVEYSITSDQWKLACHVLIILSFLSFVLCAFVFFSYLFFKHKFPSRLITYFSLTTSLNATTFLLLSPTEGRVLISATACTAQGTVNQFLSSASMLWWLCITINLYATFVKNRKVGHYEVHMHVFTWGGALAMTVPPALADQFHEAGLWCWITGFRWQMACYYVIMGLCCLIGGFMWVCIIASITHLTNKYKLSDRSAVSVHVLRQSIFIIWFLLLFCFMFFHRFYYHFNKSHVPFVVLMMHLIATSSQGIFVFLVFGLRTEIACFWRALLYRLCFRKCSERHDGFHSLDS